MKRKQFSLISIITIAAAVMQVHAATYYVSSSGNDSSGTGSSGSPWRTIQRAANAANAGDTVLIENGTYAGFHSVNSGTSANPITFKANGNSVVVNSRNTNTIDNVNIENTDYIIVDGIISNNSQRAGIRVAVSRGVQIKNTTCGTNARWGIFSGFAPEIQVLNNVCYGSAAEHGIYISNSNVAADNPVVSGNTCYSNHASGIQLNGDLYSGGDGLIEGALVERNIVYDNGSKGFSLASIKDSVIRNNVIYNNGVIAGAGGIHLAEEPGTGRPSDNNIVVNNTVVEPRIACVRITNGSGNVIFNNICVGNNSIVDEAGGNSIDAVSNIIRASNTGLFADAAGADYRLASKSPAIDAGAAAYSGKNAPVTDILGNARPSGVRHDAGAYEYGSVPAVSYSISGYVRNGSGDGIADASVSLSGAMCCSCTTGNNGFYELSGIAANGRYTVTSSKSGYVFSPANRTIGTLTGNITGYDFTGITAPSLPPEVSGELSPGEIKIVGSLKGKGIINPDDGDAARIYFKGNTIGAFTCRIFTISGELVWKELKDGIMEGEFVWQPGNAASGTYVAYVKGPGLAVKKKITVIR